MTDNAASRVESSEPKDLGRGRARNAYSSLFGLAGLTDPALTPPSMRSSAPVMYEASSEARNSIPAAISSGSPQRPSGTRSA